MDNILTSALLNMSDTLSRVHRQFDDMGKLPYRKRKLTPDEQRRRFENLTDEQIAQLVQQYGEPEVQQMLGRHMKQEELNNG